MDNIIQVLSENDFRAFKGWTSKQGNRNPVFIASFAHPYKDKPIDMYAKVYPMTCGDRSIFNEIVGYLMGKVLNIPQPEYACVAFVRIDELIKNDSINFFKTPFGQAIKDEESYPVFCTSKVEKSKTAFEFSLSRFSEILVREFCSCADYSKTTALDSSIAQIDRHLNNVLRVGKNKFYFIDNDQLVRKYDNSGWLTKDLVPNKKYTNKLYEFAKTNFTPRNFDKLNSSMVEESLKHGKAWESIVDEVNLWKDRLYQGNTADYDEFIEFLEYRCKNAYPQATSRAQLLL